MTNRDKFIGKRVRHIPQRISVYHEPLGEGTITDKGHKESSGSPYFIGVHFDSGEEYSINEYDLKLVI